MRASFSSLNRRPNSPLHHPATSSLGASLHLSFMDRKRPADESTIPAELNDRPAQSLDCNPAECSSLRNVSAKTGSTDAMLRELLRSRCFAQRILRSSTIAHFACAPPRSIARAFIPPPGVLVLLMYSVLHRTACKGDDENRENECRNAAEHDSYRLLARIFPFACYEAPDVCRDHDQGHERRPANHGAERAEALTCHAVNHGACHPEECHEGREEPVGSSSSACVLIGRAILAHQINAIGEVWYRSSKHQWQPRRIRRPHDPGSLRQRAVNQGTSISQPEIDKRRTQPTKKRG